MLSTVTDGRPGDELHLTRDLGNVVRARRWLNERLRAIPDLPALELDEAGLMLSELVTNVFRHTSSEATVHLEIRPGSVRVEVTDDEGDQTPVLQPVDPLRAGGNGIRILDAFSSSWGCEARPEGGKAVWFTLAW